MIVEIVRPGTGDPVPEGEVGEVVVTAFNRDYPLIRFGTGDLSAVLPAPLPAGARRCASKGWMGRADQTTKIKGMFVPEADRRRRQASSAAGSRSPRRRQRQRAGSHDTELPKPPVIRRW